MECFQSKVIAILFFDPFMHFLFPLIHKRGSVNDVFTPKRPNAPKVHPALLAREGKEAQQPDKSPEDKAEEAVVLKACVLLTLIGSLLVDADADDAAKADAAAAADAKGSICKDDSRREGTREHYL